MVHDVDYAATMLKFAGVEAPAGLHGGSLMSIALARQAYAAPPLAGQAPCPGL